MNAENQQVAEQKPTVAVAIYTRKSGDENLDGTVTSIDSQKEACRSYIRVQSERGWQEYPETFDDPAESGKSLNRPAMQRLLSAIMARRVKAIIAYKLDRFSRNSKDFNHLVELLEKHNVALVSATESVDTKSPQGRLMTYIMVQFAQYDRELDQERSKDYHLARARKGLWCGGLPPLGYDCKDKILIVNEGEAKLVRMIFDLYLKWRSGPRVAQELNQQGFRRKLYQTHNGRHYGGQLFDDDSVVRILQRKIYIGKIVNERTGLEFPAHYEPIIPVDVFEKVQEILEAHARRELDIEYTVNKHGFLLKGLVRCGECGSAVVGYCRPKKNKVYRYYRCLAKIDGQPVVCNFKSVVAEKLEDQVIREVASIGWQRSFLEKVVEKARLYSKESLLPLEEERDITEARRQKVRRDIQNLLNFVKAGGTSDQVTEEIRRLEGSEKEIEERLGKLGTQLRSLKTRVYDVNTIQAMFQKLAQVFPKISIQARIKITRALVNRVKVWKDRTKVDFHEVLVGDFPRCVSESSNLVVH